MPANLPTPTPGKAINTPAFHRLAPTPPRGWNSFDCFGSAVTEGELLANAELVAQRLLPLGFDVVTLDYCWSHPDPGPVENPNQSDDLTPRLAMDEWGRLLPAPERFPSAANGVGLAPIADALHRLGLRFGLHMMRGVPRQAVADRCPVHGAPASETAADIADDALRCPWLNQMVGVDVSTDAGQAYYDSVLELYASWGVDYVKADDLCSTNTGQYAGAEIEAIRKAIDRCGRDITLSLSPGPAPLPQADHLSSNANLWRMSPDFWDEWPKLLRMFDLCEAWAAHTNSPGWPDCDMLPIGPISQRGPMGPPRRCRFNHDEQRTMLTLWCIFRSPLIYGGDLRNCNDDEWTLITNPGPLEANQHGRHPRQLHREDDVVIWTSTQADEASNTHYLACFNTSDSDREYSVDLAALLGSPVASIHDLWTNQPIAAPDTTAVHLPAHGSCLWRVELA